MSNILRIKRRASGGGAGAPASLENAELAYNEQTDILYYGTGTGGPGGSATSIIAIGGSGAYATLGTTQTISGDKTFSGTVAFSGSGATSPTAVTQANGDNSTRLATTAFVKNQNYLTANQTITLSGDVTGSGTTAISTTIANNAVTLAKMATVATNTVLGRSTAGTGNVEALTTLPAAVMPAHTGDVTSSAGSVALTIATNAVTLAKFQQVATASVLGRNTAGTGNVEVLTTLPTGVMPAHTGDVTSPAGSNVTTIANDAVTNAKLANMAANTIKGNNTGGSADPVDLTVAQVKTLLAIVAADISDFHTAVRTNRLDQMTAPTASVSMNSQKITNLATPTLDGDAATKAYVDSTAAGLDVKGSVRAATTANVTLSGGAPNTLDGVTLAANDRILVKNQSTGSQNGIYIVQTLGSGSNGTWVRSADADTSAEVTSGLFVFVEEGTVNGDTGWVLTTNNPITLDTTALTFTQFSGAGSYLAGTGLTLTGTTFSVNASQTQITALGTIATGTWQATAVAAAYGGTGQTSYTVGDLLYASGATTLSKLAGVATGNALISGGVGTAPSWGKIGLTTHVSGILPVANGGTGIAYFAAAGPTTARTYTFPDQNATIMYDGQTIDGGTF